MSKNILLINLSRYANFISNSVVYYYVRLHSNKVMTTYHVQLKSDNTQDLKSDENFVIAVQLSRVVNALRSNWRAYIYISHDDKLLRTKDRLDLMLCQASMLYEAVREFSRLARHLSSLKYWETHPVEIKCLQTENNDQSSFTNTVLKNIRRKVYFHFDRDIISDRISCHSISNNVDFMIGQSLTRKDVVYTFADDLILSYIVSLLSEPELEPLEKYVRFEKKVIKLSDQLCSLFDNLIKELMRDKLKFVKEG